MSHTFCGGSCRSVVVNGDGAHHRVCSGDHLYPHHRRRRHHQWNVSLHTHINIGNFIQILNNINLINVMYRENERSCIGQPYSILTHTKRQSV